MRGLLQGHVRFSLLLILLLPLMVSPASTAQHHEQQQQQQQPECLPADRKVLLQIMDAFHGFNYSWTGTNCCLWKGVTCSLTVTDSSAHVNASRVVTLSLPALNLSTPIPAALSNLTSLRDLNLSRNSLFGPIPAQLSSLPSLHTLDLGSNNLSGPVFLLASIPSLRFINISSNRFEGGLPAYQQGPADLEELYARKSGLSGTFSPESLCKFAPKLRFLDLSYNQFDGSLGHGFSLCNQLEELLLASNKLHGSIPDDLYNATSLSALSLRNNLLSGPLREEWGRLPNLRHLLLSHNALGGLLPRTLSLNSKLVQLDFADTHLMGPIDRVDFSNLTQLEALDLSKNTFNGTIPDTLGLCLSLRSLNLAQNNLTGNIPANFNSLQNLTFLTVSTNNLHGGLLSVEKCPNLVTLFLTKNHFIEPLPTAVYGFNNLQVLALGFLNLQGAFPTWLQNCTKLQILDLSWNSLHGELPKWIGSFPHLTYLELSNNSFTGTLPAELFTLPSLIHADINTTGLQAITNTLSVKRQGGLPGLEYKHEGPPPSLLLSNNEFSGSIPPEIGQLQSLVVLDLSHNHLTGAIPSSLANITSLERLDLSYNGLSGSIPATLANLTFLAMFNVAHNDLSGSIPRRNQFLTFPSNSYDGNPGLCGAPILSTCDDILANSTDRSLKREKSIVLFVSLTAGAGMTFFLVLGYMVCRRLLLHQRSTETSKEMEGHVEEQIATFLQLLSSHQTLSIEELCKATNNFDQLNIVGCGGYGLVYRADLDNGSLLAVKKLTGDGGQMEREFWAEVEALSKAQHQNLVSLQGYAQIGNDKLLIYSYMENGSLDYWLHEQWGADGHGAESLDWARRLSIAKGAAEGLAYLHEGCNPHIVHRDIKSSNILLDEAFKAHVADFGLARLMMSTQTHVTTELVGTLGYIPPEYSGNLNATTRGDVYSFGVVLLELLTGKRPVDLCRPKESADLVAWVLNLRHTSQSHEVFDHSLFNCNEATEQLYKVLDIACCCVQKDPFRRPSMKTVALLLDQI